jgi:predicted acylesterase/phospholipase RssA
MNRFGLALSGGGFRAVLYHLGLVRFLRDAGILSRVTHISSVSGGSIIGAHLVLNWDRYNGSPNEFDAAAAELLSFVRLDVRNRIFRRFPLSLPLLGPRWLLGLSNRKLTRTGLLEYEYEKHLFGDTSLFQLPQRPELHILATNLNEGCLCSFNRNGLLIMHRQPAHAVRIERIHVGLATVPMVVTASSAFPGFFPPVELTDADVGARGGEFGRQAYTDGGVFDNLGVRLFRCLERPLLAEVPLSRDDFLDFQAVVETLCEADKSGAETPLHRLGQIMVAACSRPDLLSLSSGGPSGGAGIQPIEGPGQVGSQTSLPSPRPEVDNGDNQAVVLSILWDVLRHYQLHREPVFARLKPVDPDAEALLHSSRPGGRILKAYDQAWLNRHLLEAAFRQVTGHPCFRRLDSALDGILVSDVGKRFEVQSNPRGGGLIRTALRSTDIVMDRVWQLETETFQDSPSFVFAPITEVVELAEDPTALHPEIQRQAVNVRTDFDRFSALEISSLVRHGYWAKCHLIPIS